MDWFDVDKPHGWQHVALLEARDIISRQKEKVKGLREIISSLEREGGSAENGHLIEEAYELNEKS